MSLSALPQYPEFSRLGRTFVLSGAYHSESGTNTATLTVVYVLGNNYLSCMSMAPAAPPGKPRCWVSEGVWCLKVYDIISGPCKTLDHETHTSTCVYIRANLLAYIRSFVGYIYMPICGCGDVYIYAYIYLYIPIHMYTYIYTYTKVYR